MQKFNTLTAIAAPLPIDNVDTDMIIPKQFLKTIRRTGLKEGLFYEMSYEIDGTKIEDFVLHNAPYDKAEILVSGENFGCGSSREHAPWALLDFGIRCVIAPSFADIFFNNCFKNGILPVVLSKDQVTTLMTAATNGEQLSVDLEAQTVTINTRSVDRVSPERTSCDFQEEITEAVFTFDIEPFRKHCLLGGLDDIGLTMQKLETIDAYEIKQKKNTPWLAA